MKCSRCQIIIGPQYSPVRRLVKKRTWTFCGQECSDDHAAGLPYVPPTEKEIRHRRALQRYGLTPEKYSEILESQGGVCAICHRKRKLVVDHDHATGKIRGLLCYTCNIGLGNLGDDIAELEVAIAYLRAAHDTFTLQK